MRRAAIVCPIRTPVGKFLGTLAPVTAGELGAVILRALVARTGIDPETIDDVIFAQGYGNGEAPCIARWSALAAGLPISIPGYQLDRRCGSGLQAVIDAAMMVQTGAADVVVAGGVESMSNAEYYTTDMRGGARAGSVTLHDRLARGRVMSQPIERFGVISGMIETADNLARDYQISREACDEYAAMSHQRAAAAWESGKFDDELAPVAVPQKRGDPVLFARDEGVRADATPQSLAALKPLEKGGVVTAGNASQQNDAAAACLVVAEEMLGPLRLEPMGWFVGWAAAGCEPSRMGIGPVPAVARLFARTGLGWDDIDLVELNEAFAPQVLAVLKGWGWDERDRLERQRLGHLSGPPDRGHRRAHPGQSAARAEAPGWAPRPGDHVHRRRPGHRGGVRSGLSAAQPTPLIPAKTAERPCCRPRNSASYGSGFPVSAAIQASTRVSSTESGMAPSSSTTSWKRR